HRYGAVEALADDPDVDIVYVATPPSSHRFDVRMCLEAGKAVVCDLPLATGADEAAGLLALARERELFLLAAPWMRFLPLIRRLRALLAEGVIGTPRILSADIGVLPPANSILQPRDERTGDETLAGAAAALAALASTIFGAPVRVISERRLGSTSHTQMAAHLAYTGGQLATLMAATYVNAPQEATIIGEAGWLRIHTRWWAPEAFTLTSGVTQQVVHAPKLGNSASYVADEAMRCLRAGQLESHVMPHEETLAIMRTVDQLCHQWGAPFLEIVH
ncbi:MAG TPA: Gfo/Idh/MocA family oxidoreductase, partial [Roseiflexaceae bacterium]|nr:Gfo/Idh/MocA family oxidoreductase [Roseiflexaceae bacterium]